MKKPKERFCWGGGCYKLSDERKSGRKKEEKQTSNRNDVFFGWDVQHGSFSFPKMMPMDANGQHEIGMRSHRIHALKWSQEKMERHHQQGEVANENSAPNQNCEKKKHVAGYGSPPSSCLQLGCSKTLRSFHSRKKMWRFLFKPLFKCASFNKIQLTKINPLVRHPVPQIPPPPRLSRW